MEFVVMSEAPANAETTIVIHSVLDSENASRNTMNVTIALNASAAPSESSGVSSRRYASRLTCGAIATAATSVIEIP